MIWYQNKKNSCKWSEINLVNTRIYIKISSKFPSFIKMGGAHLYIYTCMDISISSRIHCFCRSKNKKCTGKKEEVSPIKNSTRKPEENKRKFLGSWIIGPNRIFITKFSGYVDTFSDNIASTSCRLIISYLGTCFLVNPNYRKV